MEFINQMVEDILRDGKARYTGDLRPDLRVGPELQKTSGLRNIFDRQ